MSTLDSASFEERVQQANRFLSRFPNSVPVVSIKDAKSSLPVKIHNQLFLVPKTLIASEFTVLIRKKISLPKTQAMMLFINSKVLITAEVAISELYEKYRSEDGFLYILCTDHESYGNYRI
jgi:GABA(A) receptor-associated protein